MMWRTHVAFGFAGALALLPFVEDKWVFVPIVLLASLLPDIDCMHSYLGRRMIFRPLQWFVKHRGVMHSMTFCVLASLALSIVFPVLALPFFVGYALHLVGDAVTKEGVRMWWPAEGEIRGFLRTGGFLEKIVFYGLCLLDGIMVWKMII